MGKSSGSQTSTVKNVTTLPAWYESAAKGAIADADTAADNIAKPYLGNTVAGLDPLQQQMIDLTGQNVGSTNPAFQQAGQTAAGVAGYQPGSFLTGDMSAYMNPYIQNVEQAALGNMGQAYKQTLNTIGDRAINAGAFGGSRQGVAEGVAASENARQMGDLSAQLRAQGFQQASGMMQSDMDRAMQGQGLNLQAAGMQGDLANAQQGAYLQSIQSALSAGALNQAQAQALLDQTQNQYNEMRNIPLEQLNIRLAALGGTQVPTSSTQTSRTPTSGSPFTAGLGGAMSGAQVGSMFGPIGTGIGAIGGGLLGFLSDERSKTNIQPLGVDGMTGLPMYAYDYADDVERAQMSGQPMPPKRVGPMAQDMPDDMVDEIGGMKVVRGNFGFGGY
jgi:hypothetical protein